MDTDEFSFPRISDTHAHSIDSPPLWNLSPAASPNNPYKGGENDHCFGAKLIGQGQRKSFSCVERKRFGIDDDDEEEERMDLLWEDFNEELCSTTGSATSSSREVVEFRCDPKTASTLAMANNKNDAIMIPPTKNNNKASMVMIVKVLKKLFLSVNSNSSKRKPPRRRVR